MIDSITRRAANPRRHARPRFTLLLLSLMLLAFSLPGLAQDKPDTGPDPRALSHRLDQLDTYIKRGTRNEDTLHRWSDEIDNLKGQAADCISANDEGLQKIQADLKSLGPAVKNEPADVVRKRRALARQQTELEKQLANCRLLLLRSDDARSRINDELKQLLAQRLLARGPTLTTVLHDPGTQPSVWLQATRGFMEAHSGLALLSASQIIALLALLFGLGGASLFARRWLLGWADRKSWAEHFPAVFTAPLCTPSATTCRT